MAAEDGFISTSNAGLRSGITLGGARLPWFPLEVRRSPGASSARVSLSIRSMKRMPFR